MGRRWTPRKQLFRKFRQIKGHLEEILQYLEGIKQPHEGRPEERDLVVFLTVVPHRVVEMDVLVDAALNRFKTGKFPELGNDDTPTNLSDVSEGDSIQGPSRTPATRDTTGAGTPDPLPNDTDSP